MSSTHPPATGLSSARTGRDGATPPAIHPGKFSLIQLARFGAVAVQLALLTLVVRTFDIENAAFFRLMTIACAGFVAHHFMPSRLRLPAFVVISLAAIYFVLGASNAVQIVGLGTVMIGLAHLPVAYRVRVLLIVLAAGALAAIRVGVLHAPIAGTIWPIFGAMFMFRMIVYLYDLSAGSVPVGPWRAFAYFFMLPNVCFPLFPVVDYKAFCRTYYDREDVEIYQTGIEWMFRGVLQLLVYRFVYQHMVVGPDAVVTSLDAAKFIVTAYLMYLKISGGFHIIAGMLHLFGFNLGLTNNKYFFAESFTDYWRRINIYWKEFLQKVFFNPIFFRLNKKMSGTAALVVATLTAFFITWALHSYQWFWIRGKFPVAWQDLVYWGMMGVLVLGSMLYENKYGRKRTLKKTGHTWQGSVRLALRTIATFVVVSLTWVVWSSESVGEFGMILGKLVRFDATSLAWIVGALAALGLAAAYSARRDGGKPGLAALAKPKGMVPIWGRAYQVAASCMVILVVAYLPLAINVNQDVFNIVDNLKSSRLNARDAQMLDRGYYEDLTDVVRFNSGLGDIYNQRPPNWDRNWAMHPVDGCPDYEMQPNKRVLHKGAMMTTNQWGMRDRPCEKKTPAGTYRIAIMGASHSMGTGVEDGQVFDNLVEDRLNAEHASTDGQRYEILNFSVGGYGPVQRLADFDRRVHEFDFDVLVVEAIDDVYWVTKDLVDAVHEGFDVPYPYLNQVMSEVGFTKEMSEGEGTQRLKPRVEEVMLWLDQQFVERCRRRGAVPVMMCIPHPGEVQPELRARKELTMEIGRKAGMIVVDISHAYDRVDDLKTIWITSWDSHPNVRGHQLLADGFYDGLKTQLNIDSVAPASGAATPAGGTPAATDSR